ncbi:MAG: CRISPR-associated endonuclease Cas3'', partial [Cellvibrionaceae bacterium]|nr:CRISPR-associated endonuclease Cas3'' [Cellvibrionaceae bacterium]
MDNIETILPTQLPLYYRYWGKSGQDKHHLLVYHSLDVAAVGYCLLDPNRQRGPSLAARLGVCSSWLRDLFSFCLMLHDLGKFTHGFQSLWPNQAENLIKPSAKYDYVRHDVLGMGLWTKVLKAKLTDLIGTEHCTLLMPWLSIVFAHHGQPIEPSKARQSIRKNSEELDEQAAEQFVREIIKHWMPNLEPLNNIDAKAFKLASWQLAGIAVVADWLGSNQEYFNYHSCGYTLMDYWRRIALPNAISTLKNDAFVTKHPSVFNSINDQFPFITDATATPVQQYAQQQEIATGPQLF